VAILLIATAAAMTLTQRLRQEGPIARDIKFKTREGPRYRVCFRTPRDDTVEVAIVDDAEQVVRILAHEPLPESGGADGPDEKPPAHCFDWDGTDESGQPVPSEFYRLRITLEDADRSGISGEKLRVEASATGGVGAEAG
jgi:flagellar hook assembly protein FlgD